MLAYQPLLSHLRQITSDQSFIFVKIKISRDIPGAVGAFLRLSISSTKVDVVASIATGDINWES